MKTNRTIQPISPLPANPHYFEYKGSPILLLTCDQHYGAVINADFDYVAFLDAIAEYGMNFTRIYPGAYIERDGDFVPDNNLGPRNGRQILPWARTRQAGAHEVLGGLKLDLDTWNDEYFARLHGFVEAARSRGIIVDVAFFNGMYKERWPFQPLYHANNIQGVGTCESIHVQTLKDPALADRHEAYVRRLTAELAGYENVLLDICDEPAVGGCPPELYHPWLSRLIDAVIDVERPLAHKHLIVQTIEPYTASVPKDGPGDFSSDPRVTATAHEYAWGIRHLDTEYEHGKPMILIETNYYPDQYAGRPTDSARVEAWEFIVGGGAAFMQLNSLYSTFNAAGRGTAIGVLLAQMRALRDFMARFDLRAMRQDRELVEGGVPEGVFLRASSDPGRRSALYMHRSRYAGWIIKEIGQGSCYEPVPGESPAALVVRLPRGRYRADWVEPADGRSIRTETFDHAGGTMTLVTPAFSIDVALDLSRVG
jgi:hypothetical protein